MMEKNMETTISAEGSKPLRPSCPSERIPETGIEEPLGNYMLTGFGRRSNPK